MRPDAFRDVHRILAIRLDNIGDVVMLSPALRALKQSFPAAHLTLLASPAGAQVAPMLPWVDEVIPWRAVWQEIKSAFDQPAAQEMKLVKLLKAGQYDAAYIFTSFTQSPYPPAYACYLADIPLRIGQSKEFGGFLLTHWYKPEPDPTYQVDRNLFLLRKAGLLVKDDQMELCIPDAALHSAEKILAGSGIQAGDPFILAAPGASAESRRYDIRRFARAVQDLTIQTRMPVIVIGTQRDAPTLEAFFGSAQRHPGVIPLVGKTSVSELAAIIQRSSLVITNNSASLHIAEAIGRPMIVLYSGSECLTQWAPRYTPARLLYRQVSCSPCHAFTCPFKMECLDIPSEELVNTTLSFLNDLAFGPTNIVGASSPGIGEKR